MSSAKLRFRDYLLDPDGFELCRAGHRLRLERKPMELLILLAENQGHLVKREEIIEKIWGKDFFSTPRTESIMPFAKFGPR